MTEFLIIGAGISGLLCATELKKAGHSVVVLDKGRGIGGRMATRRMAGGRLDHGAQYFTVKDPLFQAYVDTWLEAGLIREWFRHLSIDSNPEGYPRYCGVSGMTDVPKYLAQFLNVYHSQQVIELVKELGYWTACTQSGERFEARQLVMTAPLPQAITLLNTSGLSWDHGQLSKLSSVTYEKGLATLAILAGPSGIPKPGGLKMDQPPLSWIGDNYQKGISESVHTVTLHADAAFALKHWDSPDAVRGELMLEAAQNYLGAEVVEYSCHRWGYTKPINPWHVPYFENRDIQLTLAGDAFGGPRVEGAALSGLAAAARLLEKQVQAAMG